MRKSRRKHLPKHQSYPSGLAQDGWWMLPGHPEAVPLPAVALSSAASSLLHELGCLVATRLLEHQALAWGAGQKEVICPVMRMMTLVLLFFLLLFLPGGRTGSSNAISKPSLGPHTSLGEPHLLLFSALSSSEVFHVFTQTPIRVVEQGQHTGQPWRSSEKVPLLFPEIFPGTEGQGLAALLTPRKEAVGTGLEDRQGGLLSLVGEAGHGWNGSGPGAACLSPGEFS